MITLSLFQSNKYFWLYNIPDVLIDITSQPVKVEVTVSGTKVFDEILYPDEDDRVILHGVYDLVVPYISNLRYARVSINGYEAIVLRSRRYVAHDTLDAGVMLLSVSKTFFAGIDDDVTMSFLMMPGSHAVYEMVVQGMDSIGALYSVSTPMELENGSSEPEFGEIAISQLRNHFGSPIMRQLRPHSVLIVDADKNVVAEVVIVEMQNSLQLWFHNNFGENQSVRIPCSVTESPEMERTTASIYGAETVIDTRETIKYKVKCGAVPHAMADTIMDAASSDVCWLTEGEERFPVIISNLQSEKDNVCEGFVTPQFEFQRSQFAGALIR